MTQTSYAGEMASIRKRERADGTIAYAVLYTLNGSQTAATFDTEVAAVEFRDSVNTIGPERAMKAWDIGATARVQKPKGDLLEVWLKTYIASRTGVTKATLWDYNSYLTHDIAPTLGKIPITVLTRDDVSGWVQALSDSGLAGKTIANRHGFLSAALNAAVKAQLIPSNPAAGTRIPRTEKAEMVFLTGEEYALFKSCFTERWRPLLDFMVTSGLRFGEFSALKPSDVDIRHGTVHIGRARKRTYDTAQYEVGPTKTVKSNRTINVEKSVLKALDYTQEYLFTNTVGKPLHPASFRNNVWYPAVAKAQAKGLEKRPRIHDMRHTCASWMIADGTPIHVVQRHLGHESITTTIGTYGHLDRKDAEAAANRIGKRLG